MKSESAESSQSSGSVSIDRSFLTWKAVVVKIVGAFVFTGGSLSSPTDKLNVLEYVSIPPLSVPKLSVTDMTISSNEP